MVPLSLDTLDLTGLESKWTKGESVCAFCGFKFDRQYEEDELEPARCPLQLFRGQGEAMEMLTLCWDCAGVLSQRKESN
ncbi:MAG TPA: hypothetical protein VHA37_04350 [Candidatus Saccharimonadales bacterium]|nr:hypothetical protein [Candidatus Saccharimonadales bacterium]